MQLDLLGAASLLGRSLAPGSEGESKQVPNISSFFSAAVGCLRRGFAVFPLEVRGKAPLPGSHGAKDATRDLAQVRAWAVRHPEANVGVATGERWGTWVLDLDTYKGSGDELAALERQHGPLPPTLTIETGRGGFHKYWRAERGVRNRADRHLPPGIEVRGEGGHVVGPGSVHANGNTYRVVLDVPIVRAPAWLLALVRAPIAASGAEVLEIARRAAPPDGDRSRQRGLLPHACRELASTTLGRNQALNRWAYALGGTEIDYATAEHEVWLAVQSWIGEPADDPFTRREFEKTFRSGWKAGRSRPLPLLRTGGGRR